MDLINAEKLEELQSLSDGDNELLITLLDKYIPNVDKYMTQAKTEYSAGNTENMEFIFHTLKGSSLSLGLTEIGGVMSDLNQRAKNGEFDNFEPEFDTIIAMLAKVKEYRATFK